MSYEEQIMSKDKYPSIFSPQMKAIVFIILQIFYATRAVLKLGNIRPRDPFRPIARERKYLLDYKLNYLLLYNTLILAIRFLKDSVDFQGPIFQ